ncbi:hypothetical protein DYB37_012031, partial [Aphanomyces astaci]
MVQRRFAWWRQLLHFQKMVRDNLHDTAWSFPTQGYLKRPSHENKIAQSKPGELNQAVAIALSSGLRALHAGCCYYRFVHR